MSIIDPSKFQLSTRYNIQKIFKDDTVTISVTGTPTATEYTLFTHALGYIPTARVFYEPVSGQLWPLSREQYDNSGGGSGTTLTVTGEAILTTAALKVRLVNGGSTRDVTFHYRIYLDE